MTTFKCSKTRYLTSQLKHVSQLNLILKSQMQIYIQPSVDLGPALEWIFSIHKLSFQFELDDNAFSVRIIAKW